MNKWLLIEKSGLGAWLCLRVLAWNPRGGIYHATEEGWYQTLQNIGTCDEVMNEEDRVKRVKAQTILRSGGKYLGNYDDTAPNSPKTSASRELALQKHKKRNYIQASNILL